LNPISSSKKNFNASFSSFNFDSSFENRLGPYLAGLIEGDGHIYTPSLLRDLKGRKIVPSIEIAFDIKDLLLFEKIKEVLGGGYITLRKNNQSGRLFIKKRTILLKLIRLINGYMRTPKIEALHRLIDWFNNEKGSDFIIKKSEDLSSLNSNSWLSGFLEADGNFYLNWKLSKSKKFDFLIPTNIIYYLRLSQRQMYTRKVNSQISESNLNIMARIGYMLNTKVIEIERNRNEYLEKAYLIRTDKIESKDLMFAYLNKYPLFGYKRFALLNLEKIHELVRSKEHKTMKGKLKLIEYTSYMKYNSSIHKWEHLNIFYIN